MRLTLEVVFTGIGVRRHGLVTREGHDRQTGLDVPEPMLPASSLITSSRPSAEKAIVVMPPNILVGFLLVDHLSGLCIDDHQRPSLNAD